MKPFDLEAAKRGDPIVDIKSNCLAWFVGTTISEDCIVEIISTKAIVRRTKDDLCMAPKKRTVWVNLYNSPLRFAYHFASEKEANDIAGERRIGNKAYPVEIEE